MKQWLFLSFLTSAFLIPQNLLAFSGVNDESCRTKPLLADPFDVPTRTTEGSDLYSHQCIDSYRFRPVTILEDTAQSMTFANFLHEGRYWVAEISKNAEVENLIFHIVRFDVVPGVTAAHTQFRVKLKEGSEIKLSSPNSKETSSLSDIVISFEASRPADAPYNFALGAFNNYLMVGRAMSGYQRLFESRKNTTEQYEIINLAKGEKLQLLLSALEHSHSIQFKMTYNTLRPNCTTEVFDLIDQLPSQKKFNRVPFLTEAWIDPIAGPSLEGLKERGLLGKQMAFLHDELLFGRTETPDESLQKKPVQLLAEIEGAPYSLVMVTDEKKETSAETLKKAKQLAIQLLPQIILQVGSSLNKDFASESLLEGLQQLSPILNSALKKVDSQLSDQAVDVRIYLTPWDGSGRYVDVVKELDLKARLPFDTYEITGLNEAQFLFEGIGKSIHANNQKNTAYGLVAIGTHLHLIKGASKVDFQVLGSLGGQNQELGNPIESDQAIITDFVIPSYHISPLVPMALMNLSQKYQAPSPEFTIEFGPFSGIYWEKDPKTIQGHFKVDPESCKAESYSTPRLEGEIAIPKLEFLGVWKNTSFHINKVIFDLNKQKARSVEVNVKPFALLCLKDEASASKQFTEGVNEQLEKLKQKALEEGSSLGLTILDKFFVKEAQ